MAHVQAEHDGRAHHSWQLQLTGPPSRSQRSRLPRRMLWEDLCDMGLLALRKNFSPEMTRESIKAQKPRTANTERRCRESMPRGTGNRTGVPQARGQHVGVNPAGSPLWE